MAQTTTSHIMAQKQLLLALYISVYVSSQKLPSIPCPDVFKYVNENNKIHGQVTVPNDGTGFYNIAVNTSMAKMIKNANMAISLLSAVNELSKGANPIYRVAFPTQEVIPKVTQVVFNNRIYCTGPGEPLTYDGLTGMWASHTLRTNMNSGSYIPPLKSDAIYPSYPVIPNNDKPVVVVPAKPQVTTTKVEKPLLRKPKSNIPKRNPGIVERISSDCGVFSQPLLNGGADIRSGEFPWLVGIFQRINLNYVYRCVGNLISDRHVISAGHCYKLFTFNFDKDDFSLVFGKTDLSHWPLSSIIRGLKKLEIHSEYKHNSGDYDIALLTLDTPVEYNAFVRPVCLWPETVETYVVGKTATLVGWGTKKNLTHSQVARKIDLNIVNSIECASSHWTKEQAISPRTICTKGKGVGPCNGDSGAGIVMQIDQKWTLRGIVSQILENNGRVFCNPGEFTVFTDVSKFFDWITQRLI